MTTYETDKACGIDNIINIVSSGCMKDRKCVDELNET
jgi:hypothetical protein